MKFEGHLRITISKISEHFQEKSLQEIPFVPEF